MKYLDKVKVVGLKKAYLEDGVELNDVGVIWEPEIRDESFYIMFENKKGINKYCVINISDLEFVSSGDCSDKTLINDLPKNNPKWWCKVENGYIMNLLGEKKNKIPYDYNS